MTIGVPTGPPTGRGSGSKGSVDEEVTTYERLRRESIAMFKWASSHGTTPSESTVENLQTVEALSVSGYRSQPGVTLAQEDLQALMTAHRKLSRLVAPARPEVILRLEEEAQKRKDAGRLKRLYLALGPLPIARQLVMLALVFLVAFVLLAASPNVRSITARSTDQTTTTISGRP